MQDDKITQCVCGSKEFYVSESIGYMATIGESGELYCQTRDNEIDLIHCSLCGKKYEYQNFVDFIFN